MNHLLPSYLFTHFVTHPTFSGSSLHSEFLSPFLLPRVCFTNIHCQTCPSYLSNVCPHHINFGSKFISAQPPLNDSFLLVVIIMFYHLMAVCTKTLSHMTSIGNDVFCEDDHFHHYSLTSITCHIPPLPSANRVSVSC